MLEIEVFVRFGFNAFCRFVKLTCHQREKIDFTDLYFWVFLVDQSFHVSEMTGSGSQCQPCEFGIVHEPHIVI